MTIFFFFRSLGLVVCPRVRFLKKHSKALESVDSSTKIPLFDNETDSGHGNDEGISEQSDIEELEPCSMQRSLSFGLYHFCSLLLDYVQFLVFYIPYQYLIPTCIMNNFS